MDWFRYSQDYYEGWLAQHILLPAAILANASAVTFMGIHLLRRSRSDPIADCDEPPANKVKNTKRAPASITGSTRFWSAAWYFPALYSSCRAV